MRPPCEIVVTKVLPAIRTVLVKDLIDRHDLTQKEVARRLGVTQAAVSQYLSSIRGDEELGRMLKESEIFGKIRELSSEVADGGIGSARLMEDFCEICDAMRREGVLCEVHSDSTPNLSGEECDLCLEG